MDIKLLLFSLVICLANAKLEDLSLINAHKNVIAYSGSTYDAPVWSEPYISSGSCVARDTTTYVSFTATFTTSGVREIIANAKYLDYNGYLRIFVYSGASINLARPCSGLFSSELVDRYGRWGGPVVDDFVYFPAGTYTFVLSGSASFAINIIAPLGTGQIAANDTTWNVPTFDYVHGCSASGTRLAYATYSWKQGSSGLFDVSVLFSTPSSSFGPTLVLYSGIPSDEQLAKDPCKTGDLIIDYTQANSGVAATILNVNLTVEQVYTVVFSSHWQQVDGYWGVDVVPTRVRFFNSKGFNQPYVSGWCQPSNNVNSGWSANLFYTSTNGLYVVSATAAPAPYAQTQLFLFLYQGITTNGSPDDVPATCPANEPLVAAGSYSSSALLTFMFDVSHPTTYTMIASTPGQASPAQAYLIFPLTGVMIGNHPPVTSSNSIGTTAVTFTAATSTGVSSIASTTGTEGTFGGTTADAITLTYSTFLLISAVLSILL